MKKKLVAPHLSVGFLAGEHFEHCQFDYCSTWSRFTRAKNVDRLVNITVSFHARKSSMFLFVCLHYFSTKKPELRLWNPYLQEPILILVHIRDSGISPGIGPTLSPVWTACVFGQRIGSNFLDLWLRCTRRLESNILLHQTLNTRRRLRDRRLGWTTILPLKPLFNLCLWMR